MGYVLLHRLSEYAKAKEELEAALAIFEAQLGSEHVRVAEVLNSLGAACTDRWATTAERESCWSESLRILEAKYGTADFRLAPTLGTLGIVHRELGDYVKAKAMHGARAGHARGALWAASC